MGGRDRKREPKMPWITKKSELSTMAYKWLLRDQTTETFMNADLMNTYISFAEAEFNRELKIQDLMDDAALVCSTTENFIALPANFSGIMTLEFDSRPYDIEFFPTRRAMKDKYGENLGRPAGYIIQSNKIIFNCVPDSAYEMTLDYYTKVTALVGDTDTNTILAAHPDAYLYGTIRQALINIGNSARLAEVTPIYSDIINRIRENDKNSRLPSNARMQVKAPLV